LLFHWVTSKFGVDFLRYLLCALCRLRIPCLDRFSFGFVSFGSTLSSVEFSPILRSVLAWVPCALVRTGLANNLSCFGPAGAIYHFSDVLSVLAGVTWHRSWAIESKTRVLFILIVFRSRFLCHAHQVFSEICVRHRCALLA
jgi:hypothetical protein